MVLHITLRGRGMRNLPGGIFLSGSGNLLGEDMSFPGWGEMSKYLAIGGGTPSISLVEKNLLSRIPPTKKKCEQF